jgi:hypothetical protein
MLNDRELNEGIPDDWEESDVDWLDSDCYPGDYEDEFDEDFWRDSDC